MRQSRGLRAAVVGARPVTIGTGFGRWEAGIIALTVVLLASVLGTVPPLELGDPLAGLRGEDRAAADAASAAAQPANATTGPSALADLPLVDVPVAELSAGPIDGRFAEAVQITGTTWQVGVRATSAGFEGAQFAPAAAVAIGTGDEVRYERGSLIEWYRNADSGIEHGFTFLAPPAQGASPMLSVDVAFDGLTPTPVAADAVRLTHDGRPVAWYRGLVVTDATGAELPAWMTVDGDTVRLTSDTTGATFPVVIDPTFTEDQKILPRVTDTPDRFGTTLDIDPGYIVVGAPGADGVDATDTGSVAVYAGDLVSGWALDTTFSDDLHDTGYATSVAVAGTRVLVGAPGDDTNGVDAGAVYVYDWDGESWTTTVLYSCAGASCDATTPTGAFAGDRFGTSVALRDDGFYIAVGKPGANGGVGGAAIVQGTTFELLDDLSGASSAVGTEGAGESIAISATGSVVALGAPDSDIASTDDGTVALFEDTEGGYMFGGNLTSTTGASGAHFGAALAIDGSTVVVGEPFRTDPSDPGPVGAGRVTAWNANAGGTLLATAFGGTDTGFGAAVDISGADVMIGSPLNDVNGTDSGLTYRYAFDGASLSFAANYQSATTGDRQGTDVAVDAGIFVRGIPFADGAAADQGRAEVFEIATSLVASLSGAPGFPAGMDAGADIDTNDDVLVVGVPGADDAGTDAGRIDIYRESFGSWTIEQSTSVFTPGSGCSFGTAVAVGTDVLAATEDCSAVPGTPSTVHVYDYEGGSWALLTSIPDPDGGLDPLREFGADLDIAANGSLAVGSPSGSGPGVVYVYDAPGYTLAHTETDAGAGGDFGRHVAFETDFGRAILAIGNGSVLSIVDGADEFTLTTRQDLVPGIPGSYGGPVALSGPMLATIGTSSTQVTVLEDFDGDTTWTVEFSDVSTVTGEIPRAIDTNADRIVVGYPLALDGQGRTTVFQRSSVYGAWSELGDLLPPVVDSDGLGTAVAVAFDKIVASAPGDDDAAPDAGAVYSRALILQEGPGFVVNSPSDHDDGLCEELTTLGDCTLREALFAAELSFDPPDIAFDLPEDSVIVLDAALPDVTFPLIIDGSAFLGGACDAKITIDGTNTGPGVSGLNLNSGFSGAVTVRGLAFTNFGAHGLNVQSGDEHLIECSAFGLASDGVTGGNGQAGIGVTAGNFLVVRASEIAYNGTHGVAVATNPASLRTGTIGGTIPGDGNLIHDNGQDGVNVGDNAAFEVLGNSMFGNGFGGLSVLNPPLLPPEIFFASPDFVDGEVSGLAPGATYRIEVHADPSCAPADAQGADLVASDVFTADTGGLGFWSFFPLDIAPGSVLTAKVTSAGSTSEQSNCVPIGGTPQPGPDYVVNSTGDHDDGTCAVFDEVADCTLAEAINAANADGVASTIDFDGLWNGAVIATSTPLPPVTEEVVIDATNLAGGACQATIEIDGFGGDSGLELDTGTTGPVTVNGLAVTGFPNHGLIVTSGSGHLVSCSQFGVDLAGTSAGNGGDGIRIVGGSDVTVETSEIAFNGNNGVNVLTDPSVVRTGLIGSSDPALGNSIHDNDQWGIQLGQNALFEVRGNSQAGNGFGGLSAPFAPHPAPVITGADPLVIDGTVTGLTPSAPYEIELHTDLVCGDGEVFPEAQGATPLGSAAFVADITGSGSWSITDFGLLPAGTGVIAKATSGAATSAPSVCADVVEVAEPVGKIIESGADSLFGHAIDRDGNRLVVGFPHQASSPATGTRGDGAEGGVAVYERTGPTAPWVLAATILGAQEGGGDRFGTDVAVDGDLIVVGASHADDAGTDSGAAHVYAYVDGTWLPEATLAAAVPQTGGLFGTSVDVSGDTVIVGAFQEDTVGAADNAGRVHIFERNGGTWPEVHTLTGAPGDGLGIAVAVDGTLAVAGARQVDGVGAGYVATMRRGPAVWTDSDVIAAPAGAADQFGFAVDVQGDRLVVGAPDFDVVIAGPVGEPDITTLSAAFVYDHDGASWGTPATLEAVDPVFDDYFGLAVSLDGDVVVVGANQRDTAGFTDAGGAYGFALVGTDWVPLSILEAADPGAGDLFGSAVHVAGTEALVGAWADDNSNGTDAGAVYEFDLVVPEDPTLSFDLAPIGTGSVAVSGDGIVPGDVDPGALAGDPADPGDDPVVSTPLTSIDLGEPVGSSLEASPVAGTTVGDLALDQSALAAAGIPSPIDGIPLTEFELNVPIPGSSPLEFGGWEYLFGTVADRDPATATALLSRPLQNIIFGEVKALPEVEALRLDELDVAGTPLTSIPLTSILLGATPLTSIPLTSTGIPADDWCALLASIGGAFVCDDGTGNGIDPATTTLVDVSLAGVPLTSTPLTSTPLTSIPLTSTPLTSTPLTSIDVGATPLTSVPLTSIDLVGLPLTSVPLTSVPLTSVPLTSTPLTSIPLTSTPLTSISTDGTLAGIPLTSIDIGATPLTSVPLTSIPLTSTPLTSVPLTSVPLTSVPLTSVPLTSIPLTSTDLATLPLTSIDLAATPLTSTPLTSIDPGVLPSLVDCSLIDCTDPTTTLGDALAAGAILPGATFAAIVPFLGHIRWGDVADAFTDFTRAELLAAFALVVDSTGAPFTLGDFSDLADLVLGDLPDTNGTTLGDLGSALAAVRLADLVGALVDENGVPFDPVVVTQVLTQAKDALGLTLGQLLDYADMTLGDLPDTGATVLGDISSALVGIRIGDLVAGFIGFDVATAEAALRAAIAAGALTIGDLVLDEVLLGDLLDAPELSAFTLGELLQAITDQDPAALDGITLGDLLLAFLTPSDFPWDSVAFGEVDTASLPGAIAPVPFQATFQVAATSRIQTVEVTVTLPPTASYVEGSTLLAPGTAAEPQMVGDDLVWRLTGIEPDTPHTLAFSVLPSLNLGISALQGSARIVGVSGSIAAISGFEVDQAFEPNDTAATAAPIAEELIYLDHVADDADVDFFSIDVAEDERLVVTLSSLAADLDLVLYGDTATSIVPLTGTAAENPELPVAEPEIGLEGGAAAEPTNIDDLPLADLPVIAVSNNDATSNESIITGPLTAGTYVIHVFGANGASSPEPAVLQVDKLTSVGPPPCAALTVPAAPAGPATAIPADANTLIVYNQQRMEGLHADGATVTTEINDLVAFLSANVATLGIVPAVLNVDADAATRAAYDAWDANPCDPDLANGVAGLIIDQIDAVRATHDLDHIMIVGNDDVVPFARVPDATEIANEFDYRYTFAENNAIAGAAWDKTYLSDEPYGETAAIAVADRFLYVADTALGRLIDNPSEIVFQLEQFQTSGGSLDPTTGLVASYDFLDDAGEAIAADLNAAGLTVDDSLGSSSDPDNWTRADLEALFTPPDPAASFDINSINAHFDHRRLLPAAGNLTGDESDLFLAESVFNAAPGVLEGAITFSMGCHSGLSVSDATISVLNDDFAQGITARGGIYVGNTGFGYGDTETVAYSERLMQIFGEEMLVPLDLPGAPDTSTAGQALLYAKNRYLAELGALSAYDEKVVMEATFYGIPFYRVGLPSQPADPPPDNTPTVDPLTGSPKLDVTVTPDNNLTGTPRGNIYVNPDTKGEDQTLTLPFRPIQPSTSVDVSVVDPADPSTLQQVAHGTMIVGLASTYVSIDPVIAVPIFDAGSQQPEPDVDKVAFPSQPQRLRTYEAPTGTRQNLVLATGQFRDENGGAGTQRLDNVIDAVVYYADPSETDFDEPLFSSVVSSVAGNQVVVTAEVSDAGSGVDRVLVLAAQNPGAGAVVWDAFDLTQQPPGSGRWSGALALDPGTTAVEFMVQAKDNAGNVAVAKDKGANFGTPAQPPPPGGAVTITLDSTTPPVNGWNTGAVTVDVTADPFAAEVSIDGGPFLPASAPVVLDTDGIHTVDARGSDGSAASAIVLIDTTDPTASITSPLDGTVVQQGTPLPLSFGCTDTSPVTCEALVDGAPTPPGQDLGTLAAGAHTVQVTATDTVGRTTVTTASFTITAAIPLEVGPLLADEPRIIAGQPITFSLTFTDAPGTTHDVVFDFGDGTTCSTAAADPECSLVEPGGGPGTASATHTFASAADATVTATIVNNLGDDATATVALTACTIVGTPGPDFLLGTPGDDVICALDGIDVILAGAGNDLIFGDGGSDVISAGTGDDQVDGGDGIDAIGGGPGRDVLYGGPGNDALTGDSDGDILFGGPGNDVLLGWGSSDILVGEDGNDTLRGDNGIDWLIGGPGNDVIGGGNDTDLVAAGDGSDDVFAGPGNDIVNAGDGNDIVRGNDGDDRLDGGLGDDEVRGNLGTDSCVDTGNPADQFFGCELFIPGL